MAQSENVVKKYVYVVCGRDLGWDNVVGVFDMGTFSWDEIQKQFPEKDYWIFDHVIEQNFDSWS